MKSGEKKEENQNITKYSLIARHNYSPDRKHPLQKRHGKTINGMLIRW